MIGQRSKVFDAIQMIGMSVRFTESCIGKISKGEPTDPKKKGRKSNENRLRKSGVTSHLMA